MPYIPPHKRGGAAPPPTPDSLAPRFARSLTVNGRNLIPAGKVLYAPHSSSLWWPLGSPDPTDPIPASFRLTPVPGTKFLVLHGDRGSGEGGEERPWEEVAERIEAQLFECVKRAKEAVGEDGEEIKLSFLARIGKVRFKEGVSLDSIRTAASSEASWNKVHKSFYTNVSKTFMDDIQHKVVPNIGLSFDSAKEHYHVKVYDKTRPDGTIQCKCTIGEDGNLQMHKIEFNYVRHLVVDVSCLYKHMDFRLMLVNKKRLTSPDDEEKDALDELVKSAILDPDALDELVKSAILDPDVKGGLRWPLGMNAVAERFTIVGVWHTEYKAFRGRVMRLKLRHIARFDHRTSTGKVFSDVTLKLPGISEKLTDGDLDRVSLMEMLKVEVKSIWDHFLTDNNMHQLEG